MNELHNIMSDIVNNRRLHRRFAALLIIASFISAFSVNLGLIKPAESRSGELVCGMEEHQHTEACYSFICGQDEESGHVHTADCIELICGMEEHIHTDDCYDKAEEAEEPAEPLMLSEEAIEDETDTAGELTDEEAAEEPEETADDEEEIVPLETVDMMKMAVVGVGDVLALATEPNYPDTSAYYKIKTTGNHYLKYDETAKKYYQVNLADSIVDECAFKFEYAGKFDNEDYYYIDSLADGIGGDYVTVDNKNILTNAAKITNNTKQLFKIVNDGNNNLKFISKDDTGKAIDANQSHWNDEKALENPVNIYRTNSGDAATNQYFTLETSTYTPPIETDPNKTIKIEARVIFGDYKDGNFIRNNAIVNERHIYENLADSISLELMRKQGSNTGDSYDQSVHPDMVPLKIAPARKDWCYQYNKVWSELPKLTYPYGATEADTGYYVKLSRVENNQITLTINENVTGTNNEPITMQYQQTFKVYYLKDDALNHPGQYTNNNYNTDPSATFSNEDQIIYIFLDPEKDWSLKGDGTLNGTKIKHYGDVPNDLSQTTIDLQMKKRWDGHNVAGNGSKIPDEHKNEKIQIQLQRLDSNNTWVKYTRYYNNENYRNWYYYEIVDTDNKKHFVNKSAVDTSKIKNNYYVEESDIPNRTYQDLYNAELIDPPSNERLRVYQDNWNDIVLNYTGDNHPQHFTEGYYFGWNNLPYGQYRVVELRSFYDEDNTDSYTPDGGDRDTSYDYYYMSFPPSRDSSGILHIQNFTRDMVVEVQKEWNEKDGDQTYEIPYNKKQVTFELYKSDSPNISNNLEKIGEYTTNSNGYAFITSRAYDATHDGNKKGSGYYYGVQNMPIKDDADKKYYYFVKEVNVDGEDEYKLLNGDNANYVRSTNGSYGVDYEDGDARKFIIKNQPKLLLTVDKKWLARDGTEMTFAEGDAPTAKFELYRSTNKYDDPKNNDGTLTLINFNGKNQFTYPTDLKNGQLVFDESVLHMYKDKNTQLYFYLREVPNSSFEVVSPNVNSDGFVKVDGNYYFQFTENSKNKSVTVNNQPKMSLDISKKWYTNENGVDITNAVNTSAKFQIYKAFTQGEPDKNGSGYKIDNETLQLVGEFTSNSDGSYKTEDNLPAYELDTATYKYKKVYYYVKEIDGNYKLLNNGASNGFIKDEAGKFGSSYDEEGSNARKYVFENKPEMKLNVKKEWQNKQGITENQGRPQAKFVLLRSSENYMKNEGLLDNGQLPIELEGTVYRCAKDNKKTFKTIETFTTENYEKVFNETIQDIVAFKTDNNKQVSFYVVEVDGDNYNVSDYEVSYAGQGAEWSAYGDTPTITISNKDNTQESYIMPETGGRGMKDHINIGGAIMLLSAAAYVLKRRFVGTE